MGLMFSTVEMDMRTLPRRPLRRRGAMSSTEKRMRTRLRFSLSSLATAESFAPSRMRFLASRMSR